MTDLTTAASTPGDNELAIVAAPTFDAKGYVLAVFDPFKRQISKAKREAGKAEVYDITTTAGMNRAKELRALFRDIRTSVENTRKERKAPIIESGKLLDARAAELKAEVEPFEEKYDGEIKAEEQRKAAEKARKEAEERARIEAIEGRLANIRGVPGRMVNADSIAITKEIEQWTLLRLDPADYQEYLEDALAAVNTTIDQLGDLRSAAFGREAEQRRIAEERAELVRLQEEKAERERQEKIDAEKRAEEDRQRQADVEKAAKETADALAAVQRQQAQMAELMEIQQLSLTDPQDHAALKAALAKAIAFNPASYGALEPMAKMTRDASISTLNALLAALPAPEPEPVAEVVAPLVVGGEAVSAPRFASSTPAAVKRTFPGDMDFVQSLADQYKTNTTRVIDHLESINFTELRRKFYQRDHGEGV